MALTPGTRLGPYEILSALGAGGMGEVYRATDSNLKRSVAIKVLPASVAGDADRLARFQREAEVLAALNHLNIAAIYGLEKTPAFTALVMELVEGDDLSKRLAHGPIPIDEALPIAKQIARALEAAHEQGIIHRDLKPANIMVRADGAVKVLDFGLAKALEPASAQGAADQAHPSLSPTITTPAMTQAGIILGTAAYMSPEQAKGRAVDKRTDVWAFGAVLYEMITARRAFEGEDVADTLARILMKDPDWSALPATVPDAMVTVMRCCLQKDRAQRLRDIGDASLALEGAFETAAQTRPAAERGASRGRLALMTAFAGVLGVGLITALALWAPWRSPPVPTPRTLLASIGADASLSTISGASAILSADGTTLAFVALEANRTRLYIRKLDQLQADALAGTEGADSPFISPGGEWIAFFASGKLKKVAVTGGAAINLCDAPNPRGGTWADDDTIFFTSESAPNTTLMRVSAAGGTPAAFGMLSKGAVTQRWPQALPGGKAVLYSENSSQTGWGESANLVVASLSGGTSKVVVRGGHYGRYVPGGHRAGGHLIYVQQSTLFAVPFDLNRLETIGPAVPALEGVASNVAFGSAQLALSSDGTLVYVPGPAATAVRAIDWLTRDDKTSVLRAVPADWANPRFSPDGQKLAIDISSGTQRDIWVYEWARDTLTQLTFDTSDEHDAVWTPDGRRIVFASDRAKAGIANLYWVNGNGTGEVTRLTDSPDVQTPFSWHPSGKFLALQAYHAGTGNDVMILPMKVDPARGWTPGNPTAFLGTAAAETAPMFSPDGRWVAYASNESGGRAEVYVRPFPGPGGKWRISTAGGSFPRWSGITHELAFRLPAGQGPIMAAPYAAVGESFRADTPQVWSPTSIYGATTNAGYDIHPDGKRVATFALHGGGVGDEVVFVFNFADHLRRIAPGTK